MSRIKKSKVFLVILVFFATCWTVQAHASFKHKESSTFSLTKTTSPGKTLYVDTYSANLTITTGNENQAVVEAVVEVADDDEEIVKFFLAETRLSLEPYADGLRLRLTSPMDEFRKRGKPPKKGIYRRFYRGNKIFIKISYTANLTIRIPSQQSLQINNAYGNISIGGINGNLQIVNKSGKVRMDQCGGELTLTNSYDPVEIPEFNGPVNIKNSR